MIRYVYIDSALEQARESDSKYKICAIAVKHGPVGVAVSRRRTDPGLRRAGYPPHALQHAEFRLAKNFPAHLRGSTVYVARRSADGAGKMAKPCEACQKMLKRAGVKRVVFTTGSGCEVMRLK